MSTIGKVLGSLVSKGADRLLKIVINLTKINLIF